MNIDQYGLPVQLDRDASDQLQRVGMLAVAYNLQSLRIKDVTDPWRALLNLLQPSPGVYTRYTNATTKDVTGDQLIPTMAFWALTSSSEFSLMWKRLFFAQNVRKQGEPDAHTIPDFMVFRTLPLLMRAYWILHPLAILADSLLVAAVLTHVLTHTHMDDVDDNNLIITLVVCSAKCPTILSKLANILYGKLRKPNYGSIRYNVHPIIGALYWYHRTEWPSYGNAEIAMIYEPIVMKYIINRTI